MLPYLWVNVKACVHNCVSVRLCVWCMFSSLYSIVCVSEMQRSSDRPGTSSRQRGQSHSLIILTFLHNDPTHNSPFSGYFSLHPSIHLRRSCFPFPPPPYFVHDLIYLITSFSLLLFNFSVHLNSSLICWLYSCVFPSLLIFPSWILPIKSHLIFPLSPLSSQMTLRILSLSDPPVDHQVNPEVTELWAPCTRDWQW